MTLSYSVHNRCKCMWMQQIYHIKIDKLLIIPQTWCAIVVIIVSFQCNNGTCLLKFKLNINILIITKTSFACPLLHGYIIKTKMIFMWKPTNINTQYFSMCYCNFHVIKQVTSFYCIHQVTTHAERILKALKNLDTYMCTLITAMYLDHFI